MVPATWSGATDRRNRDVQTTMGVVHGYDRNYPALTSIAPHGHSHGGRITTTPAAERPRAGPVTTSLAATWPRMLVHAAP